MKKMRKTGIKRLLSAALVSSLVIAALGYTFVSSAANTITLASSGRFEYDADGNGEINGEEGDIIFDADDLVALKDAVTGLDSSLAALQTQYNNLSAEYTDYKNTHTYTNTQYNDYVSTHSYTNTQYNQNASRTYLALMRTVSIGTGYTTSANKWTTLGTYSLTRPVLYAVGTGFSSRVSNSEELCESPSAVVTYSGQTITLQDSRGYCKIQISCSGSGNSYTATISYYTYDKGHQSWNSWGWFGVSSYVTNTTTPATIKLYG